MVLGASGGVGSACVDTLAGRGVEIAAVGRSLGDQNRWSGLDGRVREYRFSGTADAEELRALVSQIAERHGDIVGLITAQGWYESTPFAELDLSRVQRTLEVNLLMPMLFTAALAPTLGASGGGRIVHLGSITSTISRGGYAAYEAAKAGLVAMTRSAAIELAPARIAVNVVEPGWIRTPMAAPFLDDADPDEIARLIPAGRPCEPSEVASLVAWLVSEAPLTLTGQSIVIDGGQRAHTQHLHADPHTAGSGPTLPRSTT
ncbi:SDR family NAD(P)-dependent oxidoreductase [uncultured Aeromicrobium sp.]|uniref:SDR family NAD(P)-dependent oxidoreductase n=1 Tax=uncultured Aeromicrobium sp. TaxID=337820 RepID=UPI0025E09504|nr:SDR family oxidoreductase [uncultured Aeromicrobium sp.]